MAIREITSGFSREWIDVLSIEGGSAYWYRLAAGAEKVEVRDEIKQGPSGVEHYIKNQVDGQIYKQVHDKTNLSVSFNTSNALETSAGTKLYLYVYDFATGPRLLFGAYKNKKFIRMDPNTKIIFETKGTTTSVKIEKGRLFEDSDAKAASSFDEFIGFLSNTESSKIAEQVTKWKNNNKFSSDNALADYVINQKSHKAGFLGGISGIGGAIAIPNQLLGVLATWVVQSEMAYALSCVYNMKPKNSDDFKNDLYMLLCDEKAVIEAFRNVGVTIAKAVTKKLVIEIKNDIKQKIIDALTEKMWELLTELLAKKIGIEGAKTAVKGAKLVFKFIPVVSSLITGGQEFANAQAFGQRAKNYYSGEGAPAAAPAPSPTPAPGGYAVAIESFTVTPSNPTPNQQVTLNWKGASGYKSLTIDQGVGSVSGPSGSKNVSIPSSGTKTWTLTAAGIAGGSASLKATVNVQAGSPPAIESFTVSPTECKPNEKVMLSWKGVYNVTALTIDQGVGSVMSGTSENSKQVSAPASGSRTWTIKATGTSGATKSLSATVKIKVDPVEIGGFSASVTEPAPNQEVTLSWKGVKGAKTITIDGSSVSGESGSKTVKAPSAAGPKTYTLKARGDGGEKIAEAKIKVVPSAVSIGSFTASPPDPKINTDVKLSWSGVTGAKSLSIEGVGTVSGIPNGYKTVKVTASGSKTWKLTAKGDGGEKSSQTSVNVQAATPTPTPPKPSPSPTPAPNSTRPNLKRPDKGGSLDVHIKYLQQRLNSKINAGLAIDGSYGEKTETAVKAFQKSKGLAVDGKCGPNTWAAIG